MTTFAQIQFAGFNLPRMSNGPTIYNATRTPLAKRLETWKRNGKTRGVVGEVTYPNRLRTAETARDFSGWGFYMEDDREAMGLRCVWCDEAPDDWDEVNHIPKIDHRGWFLNEDGDGCTARGFVAKLPRGRGFMAGWSMGEGRSSELDSGIYDDLGTAVNVADGMAENAAKEVREYREKHCFFCDEERDDCACEEATA